MKKGLLVIAGVLGLSAAVQGQPAASGSMELGEFVGMYLMPAGSTVALGFDTGAQPGTPINWTTVGVAPGRECGLAAPLCRQGSVVITAGGKPTHTVLERVVRPGTWRVVLTGAQFGIDSASLRSDAAVGPNFDALALLRAGGVSVTPHRCLQEPGSGGNTLYRVSMRGRTPGWLVLETSCGSAGCTAGLTVHPLSEEPQIECMRPEGSVAATSGVRSSMETLRNVQQVQWAEDVAAAIRRQWQTPPGDTAAFSCVVMIHQIPGGEVVRAKVEQSCGSAVRDRSVENAVMKASPLPAAPHPSLFTSSMRLRFCSSQAAC